MMWVVRSLLLVAVSACTFSANVADGGIAGARDAAVDAPPDAFDPLCFGHGAFHICLPSLPTGSTNLDGDTISTTDCDDGGMLLALGTTPVCVVAANRITLAGGQVAGVVGDKPLVLIAVTELQINGTLDASSVRDDLGPGANPSTCVPKTGTGDPAGGGGGAGGSFGSIGGHGGTGAGAGATASPPVSGPVDTLRGGCLGGGGAIGVAGTPTNGGPGGGAVLLISRAMLTLNGTINANGGGGEGAADNRIGGGGGGSGGMIVIDAGTLVVSASTRVVANGGGGAAGSGNANPGDDGRENSPTTPLVPAKGGPSSTGGAAPGGDGAAGATAARPGTLNNGGGGGGGGGGAGVIRVRGGTIPDPQISPTPSTF